MQYTVLFDVSQSANRSAHAAALGLVFIALGLAFVLFRRHLPSGTPRIFPFLFLGFALTWTSLVFFGTASDFPNLSAALRDGQCEVTEGTVTQFHPMPYEGHQNESFVVGGKRFEYSDYDSRAGFNQSQSHGGPIREGLHVRIHHVGNSIARLEVAQ